VETVAWRSRAREDVDYLRQHPDPAPRACRVAGGGGAMPSGHEDLEEVLQQQSVGPPVGDLRGLRSSLKGLQGRYDGFNRAEEEQQEAIESILAQLSALENVIDRIGTASTTQSDKVHRVTTQLLDEIDDRLSAGEELTEALQRDVRKALRSVDLERKTPKRVVDGGHVRALARAEESVDELYEGARAVNDKIDVCLKARDEVQDSEAAFISSKSASLHQQHLAATLRDEITAQQQSAEALISDSKVQIAKVQESIMNLHTDFTGLRRDFAWKIGAAQEQLAQTQDDVIAALAQQGEQVQQYEAARGDGSLNFPGLERRLFSAERDTKRRFDDLFALFRQFSDPDRSEELSAIRGFG